MPRINLLPWREQQRTERKKAFGVGMIGAAVAAAVVYGAGLLMMGAMIDSQDGRNTQLRSEIKVLDKRASDMTRARDAAAKIAAEAQEL